MYLLNRNLKVDFNVFLVFYCPLDLEKIKISITLEEEEEKKEPQGKSGIFSTTVVKSSFT